MSTSGLFQKISAMVQDYSEVAYILKNVMDFNYGLVLLHLVFTKEFTTILSTCPKITTDDKLTFIHEDKIIE